MGKISRVTNRRLKGVVCEFDIPEWNSIVIRGIETGRINKTYKVVLKNEEGTYTYILQEINTQVFKNVEAVMHNALVVSAHIRATGRESLEYVLTHDGKPLLMFDGKAYRMTKFISADVLQTIRCEADMKMLGEAVGDFSMGVSLLPTKELKVTIPNFHNTPERYVTLLESAMKNDERKYNALPELKYIMENRDVLRIIQSSMELGNIPLRIAHNDTKLNNVLFDGMTNTQKCMIDLDTVMPGTVLFDIADAIRYGANTASEEELDLSKVSLDLGLVRAFLEGFQETADLLLTDVEKVLIPIAIKTMAIELGIRFLKDYFDGDVYFQTSMPEQNLHRARVQLELAKDVDKKLGEIAQIVAEVLQ